MAKGAPSPPLGPRWRARGTRRDERSHREITEETRAMLGITPGLIRLSVGLEDPDDLLDDLKAAIRNLSE